MLTQAMLKEKLHYDPMSGIFTWASKGRGRKRNNLTAGCNHSVKGYVYITIDKKGFMAHRLAFLYMSGNFPNGQVDHINGIRSDNRWQNLRAANTFENNRNAKCKSSSLTGVKGVTCRKESGRYRAHICFNRERIWLGTFDTIEEAATAYAEASRKYHQEFGRTA